jgi:hypothetical protein
MRAVIIEPDYWKSIKVEVYKQWPNLNYSELEGTKGNIEKIEKLISQYYGDKNFKFYLYCNELQTEIEVCRDYSTCE